MEFKERLLKIIDTYENGSKSLFAAKTGIHNQIYNLLKPGYKPRKVTIDRIMSVYPNVSVQWLMSDIGDMATVNTAVQHKEEKADKFTLAELPDHLTAHQVLSHVLKYSGTDSLAKLSVKLNLKLTDLNRVYNGVKPMGIRLAKVIHKAFPELPFQWIRTGENPTRKPQSSPKKQDIVKHPVNDSVPAKTLRSTGTAKRQIQAPVNDSAPAKTLRSTGRAKRQIQAPVNDSAPAKTLRSTGRAKRQIQTPVNDSAPVQTLQSTDAAKLQIQEPVNDSAPVKTLRSTGRAKRQIQEPVNDSAPVKILQSVDDKSYIQALELRIQSILKINEGLLSDYQKIIEINQRLNHAVIELTEKVIFNSKSFL